MEATFVTTAGRHGMTTLGAFVLGVAALAACEPWPELPSVALGRHCNGAHLELCDVRRAACQADVAELTACMRDMPPAAVPEIGVISIGEFETLLRDVDPGDVERANRVGRALALVDLADPTTPLVDSGIAASLATTAAFYDTVDKTVSIIDRGQPLDDIESMSILAHEVTHGLQDDQYGLDAFYAQHGTDDDRALALDAVIEGDARLYQVMMALLLRRESYWAFDWAAEYAGQEADALAATVTARAPMVMTPRTFPYAFGARFVSQAWLTGQAPQVDLLWGSPPVSSGQIMAGYSATRLLAEPWAEVIAAEPLMPASLSNFAPIATTALGEWHVRVLRLRLSPVSAVVTPGWRGDRLFVYHRAQPDAVALIWVVRWSAFENRAAAFADLLARVAAGRPWRFATSGRSAVLVASDDPAVLDDLWAAGEPLLAP